MIPTLMPRYPRQCFESLLTLQTKTYGMSKVALAVYRECPYGLVCNIWRQVSFDGKEQVSVNRRREIDQTHC